MNKAKAKPTAKVFYGQQAIYKMNESTRRQIANTRKGKPAPTVDEPIRAAIARQAAAPLPTGTPTIYAAFGSDSEGAYTRLHQLATEKGWGDNYTIRTETKGFRGYKNPRQ
jgi:hypothetical protein